MIGIFCFVLVVFTSNDILGQTYTEADAVQTSDNFQRRATQLNFLSDQIPTSSTVRQSTSAANSIYIQQIGNLNSTVANTRSLSSDINLLQRGNNNDIHMTVKAASIETTIFQSGYNNQVLDISPTGVRSQRGLIVQRGTNQRLAWIGDNSISQRMVVRMQGRNQSIIIRSVK